MNARTIVHGASAILDMDAALDTRDGYIIERTRALPLAGLCDVAWRRAQALKAADCRDYHVMLRRMA